MKKFIAIALFATSFNSFANDLDCAKSGSKISMDKKNVVIESANIPMTDDIRRLVTQTTGDMDADAPTRVSVRISFPKKGLKCSPGMPKVFNCTGSTKKASVEVSVTQQTMFGASNLRSMQQPIKIENIDISSGVGAQGPVVLGSGPTTVNLDQVTVKSSMFVKMMGNFQLDLTQAFNTVECK
jgi:hypothetical protein